MTFVDKVRVTARAGAGGDGCLAFRREKFIEWGGPNGGDGGKGGDIYLIADRNVGTLLDFATRPHLIAKEGNNGKGSQKTGRGAEDMVERVPVGTVVYRREPNGVTRTFLADLAEPGEKVLIARGGRGGRGNLSFKTHTNKAPHIAERGEPGEENEIDLELKLIADVGLAGFPNAGKSSLLARLSNARPKVADYPFTTLAPHLGIVKHKEATFVMADIPGLIEGAHEGKGLGDEFLRHVERTRMILHLVDPMGFSGGTPLEGIKVIENELKSFSDMLWTKPRAIVVTKMDLPEGEKVLKQIKTRFRARKIFAISTATGAGVTALLDFVIKEVVRLKKKSEAVIRSLPEPGTEARKAKLEAGYRVGRELSGPYRVSGKEVERMANMANMTQPQSVERFQRRMKKLGIDKALRKIGVKDGDLVRIGTLELEWGEGEQE